LFGVALGVLLIMAKPYADEVFDVLLIAMGLMSVVLNLPSFLYSLFHVRRKGEWIHLLISAVSIVFGVLLMLIRRDVILLVLAIFTILLPIVRVVLVSDRKKQFKRELPVMIFGGFMLFVSLTEVEKTVFTVCAVAAFALSALYLLCSLFLLRRRLSLIAEMEKQQQILEQTQE
jgi:uncharacterized membrane protein HdeD (DUF308 family)